MPCNILARIAANAKSLKVLLTGPIPESALEFRNAIDAIDHEIIGHGLKGSRLDSIAENVMRPGHHRSRHQGHIARNQAKIAALSHAGEASIGAARGSPAL
jgi:hypothetical protein